MNVKEVAEYIGMSRSKIYYLMKRGEIPYAKIGGRQYKFPREIILDWVKNKALSWGIRFSTYGDATKL